MKEQVRNMNMNMSKKVLVVEDEIEIRQLIVLHLKREGFEVDEVADGESALRKLSENDYSIVLLDWMLPQMSGVEITKWMRVQNSLKRTPILMVTAKVDPEHVAAGLDAGADDYLPKPFDTLVLKARVNALMRRSQWLKAAGEIVKDVHIGALTLKPEQYEIHMDGHKMDLTKSEYKLLETLMSHQGKVLSRERLINEIQGSDVNVVGRTVDTHVFGLRKKLGHHSDLIETIRGIGYRVKYLDQQ